MNLSGLSELQKKLLKMALEAHYRMPLNVTYGDSGFGIKPMMRKIENRKERARRRAAAGLSIARLIRRGLLESCSRGRWRLSKRGVAIAKKLHPEIKEPTAQEVEKDRARMEALREAIHAARPGLGSRRRRKPRAKAPKRVAAVGKAGIEIKMDF
jgi:restriction endonuclease Mrr